MAVETKQVRNTNFLKLLIEVESLIQAGYGIDHRGTLFNGIQFRVNMVRNSDVTSEAVISEESIKETSTEAKAEDEKVTPKNTTKKTAKTKSPVNTTVEVKKDGE